MGEFPNRDMGGDFKVIWDTEAVKRTGSKQKGGRQMWGRKKEREREKWGKRVRENGYNKLERNKKNKTQALREMWQMHIKLSSQPGGYLGAEHKKLPGIELLQNDLI